MLLVMMMGFGGCAAPSDSPAGQNCQWTETGNPSLDLRKSADQKHLRDDALTAEDLAIRHTDRTAGPGSGHFGGFRDYGDRLRACMDLLFEGVANHHGVAVALVRQYCLVRNTTADSAVILSFGLFYVLIAYCVAAGLVRRFPSDEPLAAVLAVVVISLAISILGVMLGELWSMLIEMFRLGNGHLSYRMERIPWVRHRTLLFLCGLIIFWLTVAIRYSIRGRSNPGDRLRGTTSKSILLLDRSK